MLSLLTQLAAISVIQLHLVEADGLHEGILIHSKTSKRPGQAGHGEGCAAGAEVREVSGFQIMLGCLATARTLDFALSRG